MMGRRTIVTHGRLAVREHRLDAARNRRHGTQIMSFEQVAVRLAGGFAKPIDVECLRMSVQNVLPTTALGELENIKLLPGMVNASARTLHKAWRAGIDLTARAGEHPRLDALARLESAVLSQLPPGMMRPADLVVAATRRLSNAPAVIGPVEIVGITELSPCWRPLLQALTKQIDVTWTAGPRPVPPWLDVTDVTIARTEPKAPEISAVSAASVYHEAVEAMRWMRALLASGEAEPTEIAIAAASTAPYDDIFLALRADANLDLHFGHGIKITTTREGQTAAALSEILIRGLSQTRIRRLAALSDSDGSPFRRLPVGWMRILPIDAPLASHASWMRLFERLKASDWPDGKDHTAVLRGIVDLLSKGHPAADEIGSSLLGPRALTIWRKALIAGPSGSLDKTLETLKQTDSIEACASAAWMPANALAASPRKFVRLIGLNGSSWPRGISEDRLISDHIIPTTEFDPLPVSTTDRRDFDTILATTERQVVLSRARRDVEGRLLGRSALLTGYDDESYLRRNAVPSHAFSETDRLVARPRDFAGAARAKSARACWRDWRRPEITPHDGLVRADHPLLLDLLTQSQSASSLRLLLRNPLGFVWRYALRLRTPESGTDPLVLDPLGYGDLVHRTLDLTLKQLEATGGLAAAGDDQVATAVRNVIGEIADLWESEQAVPPPVIWRRTLDDVAAVAARALTYGERGEDDTRSYGEVAFGGVEANSDADLPWDPANPVEIPETGLTIKGYIDRLDLSETADRVLVRDYKTGRPPKDDIIINGGLELQRCLYAFAVKALLGDTISIRASLLYPRDEVELQLPAPDATLVELTRYLQAAVSNLTAGNAVVGPDAGGDHDDLAFALPANAVATYCARKWPAAIKILGGAADVWEAR